MNAHSVFKLVLSAILLSHVVSCSTTPTHSYYQSPPRYTNAPPYNNWQRNNYNQPQYPNNNYGYNNYGNNYGGGAGQNGYGYNGYSQNG
ncbi:MAG: hypothetical protein Q8S55_10400, partial [Methylococcaceae bacterium]|nr:hypothetical protein [Methylococcaceae bacterium]